MGANFPATEEVASNATLAAARVREALHPGVFRVMKPGAAV